MTNSKQIEYWNSKSGQKWRELQEPIDVLFQGVSDRLLEIASPENGMHVLEIGCGTGALAIELSDQVGMEGSVLGVDVSESLLAKANERTSAKNINFRLADAQVLPMDQSTYDLVISRFGVMFFEDSVAAFKNIGKSLKPNARIVFAAWSSVANNPWFKITRDAAVIHLGSPSPQPDNAPGPIAFADTQYVSDLLRSAGMSKITFSEETIPLVFHGDEKDAASLACYLGPVARIAKEKSATNEDLNIIKQSVESELIKFKSGSKVEVPAKINYFVCER